MVPIVLFLFREEPHNGLRRRCLLGALFALPVSAAEESAAAASDPTVWQNGLFALWFRTLGGTQQLLTYALGNLLIVAAAYLLGSLNFAIIVSKKLYGKDIRKYGSHNAGMTNMFRTFGKKAGLLTLAGDAGKALVSVLLGRLLLGEDGAVYHAQYVFIFRKEAS